MVTLVSNPLLARDLCGQFHLEGGVGQLRRKEIMLVKAAERVQPCGSFDTDQAYREIRVVGLIGGLGSVSGSLAMERVELDLIECVITHSETGCRLCPRVTDREDEGEIRVRD